MSAKVQTTFQKNIEGFEYELPFDKNIDTGISQNPTWLKKDLETENS